MVANNQEDSVTPPDQADPAPAETTEQVEPSPEESVAEPDYLDIDDDLGSRHVRVKVDGEEVSVPLNEALQGYQRQADYTRSKQEIARQRQEAEQAIQLARAFEANPGMTVRILADRAGMPVEEFVGLTPAQQQAAVAQGDAEDEYLDPLERQLAEERNAREALEQRIVQREADEYVRNIVTGMKQQFGIDDGQVREVVATAMRMNLPPDALPMVYQSMAFQKMTAQQQARQQAGEQQAATEAQRRAAAQAAAQTIGNGASANGVTGTPANQEFTNYRDAIAAAFEQHGGVPG